MTNKLNFTEKIAATVAAQCHAAYPALALHFIPHGPGQLVERMALAQDEVKRLPAGESVKQILAKEPMIERSSLLGIGMKTGSGFLGLGRRDKFLALININTDDFEDTRQARHLIYHLSWHAIDLMRFRKLPENKEKFPGGPMVPRRAPVNMAIANLKADIFATTMNIMQGQKDALEQLARMRAMHSITPYRLHRVEDYPYVIAVEALKYRLDHLSQRGTPPSNQMIAKALNLCDEVAKDFGEAEIKQWHAFAFPAQNMAWASHPPDEILGAAVNTSENPYIRATGYLVAEFTDIMPLSASTMMSRYNSFTGFERNERLHKERMDSIFEAALVRGIQEENNRSFAEAANAQNEKLAEGSILGWCAGALQAAGEIFGTSLGNGKDHAAVLARSRFNDQKEKTGWNDLVHLGENLIEKKRDGYTTTLADILDYAEDKGLTPIAHSMQRTMSDPSYQHTLQVTNNLAPKGPAPARLAPRAPTPHAPAPSAPLPSAPAGPTLGGSSSQMVRARMLTRQKRLAQEKAQKSTE